MKINAPLLLSAVALGLAGYMLYRKIREGEPREGHALPINYQAQAGVQHIAQADTSHLAPRHPAAIAMKTVQNTQRSCACA